MNRQGAEAQRRLEILDEDFAHQVRGFLPRHYKRKDVREERKMQHGFMSPVEAMLEWRPDLTPAQAEAQLESNIVQRARRLQLMAEHNMPGNPADDGNYVAQLQVARPTPPSRASAMGGYPVDWQRPWEELADGCPRGWIDNPFTAALRPYIPRRTSTGGRDRNYRLERCADWLIHEAVELFIHEQERCFVELDEQRQRLAEQRRA